MRLPFFKKKQVEERSGGWWPGSQYLRNVCPGLTSPAPAEYLLAAVMSCIQAISSAISTLPVGVYLASGKNNVECLSHALMGLIKDGPNKTQTWPDLIEYMMAQVLLYGNALAEVVADSQGRVVELRPIPWPNVAPQLLPTGRMCFDVSETGLYGSPGGRVRRLLTDDVIHLADRSDDGLVGVPRLQRSAGAIQTAMSVYEMAKSVFEGGCFPSGTIETAAKMDKEQRGEMQEAYSAFNQGPKRAGRLMVLDNGLTMKPMSIKPVDSQTLETQKFNVEEICRVFQVPPPIVQSYEFNTFTNSEQAGRWFAQFCLAPWIKKLEAAFNRALFPGTEYFISWDMSGFDRGDSTTRWQNYATAIDKGILLVNEVREMEGFDPLPDNGRADAGQEVTA